MNNLVFGAEARARVLRVCTQTSHTDFTSTQKQLRVKPIVFYPSRQTQNMYWLESKEKKSHVAILKTQI